jgi:FkbM family methyltransferase
MLHSAYLRMHEGTVLTISDGALKDYRWVRLGRTFDCKYADTSYEIDLQRVLAEHLKPGMTFYDVGSHGGFFALLGAKFVGSAGNVVCFEAHPATAKCCERELQINNITNVALINAAVSNAPGTVTFYEGPIPSMASLVLAQGNAISIPAITLDQVIESHPAPHVIKMDIEGAEARALKGARKLLTEARPILIAEIHGAEGEEYCREIEKLGYRNEPIALGLGRQQFWSTNGQILSVPV